MSRPGERDASGARSTQAQEGAAAPVAAAAPARQGPSDLTLSFVDEPTVRSIAAAVSEPDWLLADRLAGLRAFEALPIESNTLYTSYVDLRNARLGAATPYLPGAAPARAACRSDVPEGAAAYAEYCEDSVAAIEVSPEAAAAGVVVETLAQLATRDPKLLRRLLEGGCALPENDKLAQADSGAVEPRPVRERAGRSAPGAADRPALDDGRAGSGHAVADDHLHRLRRRGLDHRGAGHRREQLGSGRSIARPGLLRRHHGGQAGRRLVALVRRPAGLRVGADCLPAPFGRPRQSIHRPLDAGSARQPGRSKSDRQRSRGRRLVRGAGRDRVRLVGPAVRSDVLHAPHRAATPQAIC